MRIAITLLAAALVAAAGCSKEPDDTLPAYVYPECADDPNGCRGESAFLCALGKIKEKHDECSQKEDCVFADGPEPLGCVSMCSFTAVRQGRENAYEREVDTELHRYCAQANCHTSLNCPRPANATPDCVEGRCVVVEGPWELPDGGVF